ncbi:MAG: AraC family transcriptional regulator [Ignavibacteriales bacterium]|nr:MAG: AraC family transcriptional regulator [Ignavibacteriales bacterium]
MQGVLLSILLFTKKTNHTANVVLAIAILALSVDVFHSAYILFEYYYGFPHFMGVPYAFPFLYGPIFYLYAKLISSGGDLFDKKNYLHFIPFTLVVIYGFIFVYLQGAEFKIALIKGENVSEVPGLRILDYLKPVHGIIYTVLTIRVVRFYNNKIRNSYSNIEKINLDWLKHLTIGLSLVWSIVLISYIVDIFSEKNINMDSLIYLAATVVIYSIGYLSLQQPQIFQPAAQKDETQVSPELKQPSGEVKSYQKSGLSETDAKDHLKNLLELMQTDKPYLNSELTLRELADKLSVSTHNLSELLNTRLNQSFYDFINHYRVEEVKKKLAEGESEKYNLISIAFDSGFNSKTAFNTIFKKQTGVTPSQYRKQLS